MTASLKTGGGEAEPRRNVFVLGYDEDHDREIEAVCEPERYAFHPLLMSDELIQQDAYDIEALLDEARKILDDFAGNVDAIICHWDFPAMPLHSILCREYKVKAPSLEAVLKCAHKYWSRLEQRKAAPEATPDFSVFDPHDEDALDQIDVDYPFWIKPIKGFSSMLGFLIEKEADFRDAMKQTRREIGRLGDPFEQILKHVDLPDELKDIHGDFMIAERYITGDELAPEGHVQNGECQAHAVVDMVFSENGKSFQRYEYPSVAPDDIQKRASEIAARVMEHIGFDDGCFNMEFFWNREEEKLWIVEINPRISQSHSNIFKKVDGISNHEVAIKMALGEEPGIIKGEGEFKRAAKFLYRRFDTGDGIAERVPTDADTRRLREKQPHTRVQILLQENMKLSELKEQDSYSYCMAHLQIGARDREELERKFEEAKECLPFEIRTLEEGEVESA
ncbi:MAG: acetyl-CoA carboxylase biotin carboxylase subunit family protein [Opitutales bacterium]